jgi:anti-sigma B factor antagonist
VSQLIDQAIPSSPRVVECGALRVTTGPESETCLVHLAGELDLESGPALNSEVRRLLASDLETIVVDLCDLEFIDSTGLQCLVRLARAANERRRTLLFTRPRGHVAKVFRLTEINRALALA